MAEATKMIAPHSLSTILKPRSIAIIGASNSPAKVGYNVLRNLIDIGYEGKIYPINPTDDQVLGIKAYKSVLDVPGEIDLAALGVPSKAVLGIVDECARKGVKGAVVYVAGFAEVDQEGARLQEKMLQIARSAGMRIFGPNINGIINSSAKMNLSFNPFPKYGGPVSLLTQSGALGSALFYRAVEEGLSFEKFIAIGNKSDIDEIEVLEFLENDETTRAIAMYLEGVKSGKRLIETAKRLTPKKPIVAIKIGATKAGSRAALSHTGSITGDDAINTAAFKQGGIVRVSGPTEMIDTLIALLNQPAPAGNRVHILTTAGGIGAVCTETCEKNGLDVVLTGEETAQNLRKIMSGFMSVKNPVDLTVTDYATIKTVVEILIDSPDNDCIILNLLINVFQSIEDVARLWSEVRERAKKKGKTLICCLMGKPGTIEGIVTIRSVGLPAYPTPERAAFTMAKLYEYGHLQRKLKAQAT